MTEVRRLSRRISRARLDHVCELCGGVIERGQEYVRIAGMVDGRFGVMKYHRPSMEAEQDLCDKPMRPLKPFWALDREEEE